MLKLEKFDGTKTYMFPNGKLAAPETIREHFPAVNQFTHVIEVNGEVCQAVMNLSALRALHGIDSELNEADAIQALEDKMNEPPEVVVTPEERLAAAAEFQNIVALPDTETIVDTTEDKIMQDNVKKGLWGTAHLNIIVQKGLLTQEHADTMTGKAKVVSLK